MPDLQYPASILHEGRVESNNYTSLESMQSMARKLENFFAGMGMPVTVAEHKDNNVAVIFVLVYKDVEGKAPKRFETKVREVKNLQKDIELCLSSPIEIAEGENTIILAVKNFHRRSVSLKQLIGCGEFIHHPSTLAVAAGTNITGGHFVFDLAALGNLLIVGVTGAGKSVFLNDIILSTLAKSTPEQLQYVFMDFKRVELQHFEGLTPYLFYEKTIKNPLEAVEKLKALRDLSRSRAEQLAKLGFNQYSRLPQGEDDEPLPRVLIIIDEFIELYQQLLNIVPLRKANELWKEVLNCLEEISGNTVQTGMHLVLVAQTPVAYKPNERKNENIEWDIIDALRFIRTRACLVATSQEELKRIVNMTFTDRLLGEGDMFFYQGFEDRGRHIQTANVTPEDADTVVRYIRQKYGLTPA